MSLCELSLVLSENRVCCCGMSVKIEVEAYQGSDDIESTSCIAQVEPAVCYRPKEQLVMGVRGDGALKGMGLPGLLVLCQVVWGIGICFSRLCVSIKLQQWLGAVRETSDAWHVSGCRWGCLYG